MKKLMLVTAILATVSLNGLVSAGGLKSEVKLSLLNDTKFRVVFENPEARSTLSIRDENGFILYSETIGKSNKYVKVFDFSSMGDGKYTFVVISGKEKVEKPFEIITNITRTVTAAE